MRCAAHLAALALLFGTVPALADEANEWPRASSLDQRISAATPCSLAEIDRLRAIAPVTNNNGANAMLSDVASRILCVNGNEIYVARLLNLPAAVPADGTLFDVFLARMEGKHTDGAPQLNELAGRRAFINRENSGGTIAESGLIEVGASSVLIYNVGTGLKGGPAETARIDHFRDSLRIESQ